MEQIQKFNSANVGSLRPVIEKALSILEKYGLSVSVGKLTYGDTQFTARIEVSTDNNGQSEFKKYAKMFNLKPEWFGKTFDLKGATYEVVGLDAGKRTFPVVLRGPDGKTVTFTADGLRVALGDGDAVEKEQKQELRDNYLLDADDDNLNRAWLDQEVLIAGDTFKVVGRHKSKVVISGTDGKLRATPVEAFLALLKKKENKHLLAMPKLTYQEYFKKHEAA